MLNKIRKIFSENDMEEIYYTGVFDDQDKEFITSKNYLYIEFGNQFLELEAIESYSKLQVAIVDSIPKRNILEDMETGVVRVGDLVLTNPLIADRKIKSTTFYNLEIKNDILLSDVILIRLAQDQYIFIDPQFLGINIGNLEQKKCWEDNLKVNETIKLTEIEFS